MSFRATAVSSEEKARAKIGCRVSTDRGCVLVEELSERAERPHVGRGVTCDGSTMFGSVRSGSSSWERAWWRGRARKVPIVSGKTSRTLEHTRVALGVLQHAANGLRRGRERARHLERRESRVHHGIRRAPRGPGRGLELHLRRVEGRWSRLARNLGRSGKKRGWDGTRREVGAARARREIGGYASRTRAPRSRAPSRTMSRRVY